MGLACRVSAGHDQLAPDLPQVLCRAIMTGQTPPGDIDLILDRTETLWKELGNDRLFITGGTGFFGRWILESLIQANDRFGTRTSAVVLTRDPAAFRRDAPELATSGA